MWSFIHKHLQGFLSLLFAVAVALFWAFPYRCALSYQEQYQLFLFTPSYFTERISVPGGLADYVAEFITQFYYVYALGTILLALVFFCLQRLTWVLMRRSGVSPSWYLLSFIPTMALWALMGNENVLLSFAMRSCSTISSFATIVVAGQLLPSICSSPFPWATGWWDRW